MQMFVRAAGRLKVLTVLITLTSSLLALTASAQVRFDVLHAFAPALVGPSTASLVSAPDGALYGTMLFGGPSDAGYVYRVTADGTFAMIHAFDYADGALPGSSLAIGSDGLYGTTQSGGANGLGTVFRIAWTGEFDLIHSFGYVDGGSPAGALVRGADDAWYGTARIGGEGDGGVFRVAGRTVTLVHAFTAEDGRPYIGGLSSGPDGTLYGTNTFGGGADDAGTVFKLATDGTFTRLHIFTRADGAWPYAPPTVAVDGSVYGTTARGGAANAGTVYRLATGGGFSVVHEFDQADGEEPLAPLLRAADGSLYGTTLGSLAPGRRGSIFKVSAAGLFSLVHQFAGADGGELWSPLVEGPNQTLYGVTRGGGTSAAGTIFSLTREGAFALRHSFQYTDGADPQAALVVGADGALYGTAAFGGAENGGVAFRFELTPDTTPPVVEAHVVDAPNASGWYRSDVLVQFTCMDEGGSGIPDGACPAEQILSLEGGAVASTAMTVTDAAGNVSAPSNVVVVAIDKTAPVMNPLVTPATVTVNGTATVLTRGADALSGVSTEYCSGLETATVGPRSLTCTVVDMAGNVTTQTVNYAVVYGFNGFLQPVNDPANATCRNCELSVFKNGSTISVRFQLKDASGAPLASASAPQWLAPVRVGTTSARINEDVEKEDGTPGTSYRRAGPSYVYNWSPKGLPSGSVWRIGVRLDDGQTYVVNVAVR